MFVYELYSGDRVTLKGSVVDEPAALGCVTGNVGRLISGVCVDLRCV